MSAPVSEDHLRQVWAAYQKCGTEQGTAQALGRTRPTVQHWLREIVRRGIATREEFEAVPKPKRSATINVSVQPDAPPADPVELRRLRDTLERVTKERDEAVRRALDAEDLRTGVLGLGEPKPARTRPIVHRETKAGRTVIVHLSDVHYGETVSLAEMGGINSYSPAIADRRLSVLFDKVCSLLSEHWKGKPPEKVIVCLGGDLISGAIHEELAKTDALSRLPSVRAVAARLADGIRQIRKEIGCPVDVFSVPGNHGRLTLKPESKSVAVNSFDTLAAWFLEADLRTDKGVSVYYPDDIDCTFEVYGRTWLLTHGDKMGSKGGQGFVGPAATIARGHQKLHADYAARGVNLYRILTGHLHTSMSLTLGDSNGSTVGPSQYSRDMRARAEPASQNMTVIHSEIGIIDWRRLMIGSPDEGSIYGHA